MDESLLDLTKIGVKLNCRPRWRAEFFSDMKQNCFCKIFLDPDPVKCSSKVKRLIFPTVLLLKVRMLQLCSSYVRERKRSKSPPDFCEVGVLLRNRTQNAKRFSSWICGSLLLKSMSQKLCFYLTKSLFRFGLRFWIWIPFESRSA